jgi:hypothetical protein
MTTWLLKTSLPKGGVQPKIVSERLGHINMDITPNIDSRVLPGSQERMVAGSSALAGMGR